MVKVLQSDVRYPTANIRGLEPLLKYEAGDMLGQAAYRALFDNDSYLNGFADRQIPVVNGVSRTYVSNETSVVIWDGWVYVSANYDELHYSIDVESVDNDYPSTVSLYFDGDDSDGDLVDEVTVDASASDTFDASGYDPGLHRVYCVMKRAGGSVDYNATGTCLGPWLEYSPVMAWPEHASTTDGDVPTAASLAVWGTYDTNFSKRLSPNAGFLRVARSWVGDEHALVIWNGWVEHDEQMLRVSYRASLDGIEDSTSLELWYDYDNAVNDTRLVLIENTADHESYADIPASTFTPGTLYRVAWVLKRTSHVGVKATATINYTRTGPVAADAAFTHPSIPAVNQYVFGDTAGEGSRAELLSSNDLALYDRQSLAYRRYAGRKAEYSDLGGSGGEWAYEFERQGDVLYYRTTGSAALTWGGAGDDEKSETLEDYDDDNPYRELDLCELDGLEYGMTYLVSDGQIEFAMEV